VSVLRVPFDLLPISDERRHGMLRDYFCDKDAISALVGNEWELVLEWPDGHARHVDPRLQEGFEWWQQGIARSSMALSRRRSGKILSALYDTWTLHSWSQWIERSGVQTASDVIILHIDDHKDVAPPRLRAEGDQFVDAISGSLVSIADPTSIQSAIQSGAIGMGSFMTPFLHAIPTAEVRHLCQPPKVTNTNDHKISLAYKADTLLHLGSRRPCIELVQSVNETGRGRYRITPHLDDWLEDITGNDVSPILLHIDMDYFNNRYDGDSEWVTRKAVLDPPIEDVFAKIDEITAALEKMNLGLRIVDTVIAYSPGFFPAEFWRAAGERLVSRLNRLYANSTKNR